jgi:hypothetical protein
LYAAVMINNKSGHKLPSGVGFRRAFVNFRVLDQAGRTLWESGRTNGAGVIVDQSEEPIAGDCGGSPIAVLGLSRATPIGRTIR